MEMPFFIFTEPRIEHNKDIKHNECTKYFYIVMYILKNDLKFNLKILNDTSGAK